MGKCGRLSRPLRQCFEVHGFAVQGESQGAGEEEGGGGGVAGAVFVVAHQGESPGGELDADLVAAAGVQEDAHQGGFAGAEAGEFQPGGLDALALPLHHEYLIFGAVLPQ